MTSPFLKSNLVAMTTSSHSGAERRRACPGAVQDEEPFLNTHKAVHLAPPYNYRSAPGAIGAVRPKKSSSFQEIGSFHLTPVRFRSAGVFFFGALFLRIPVQAKV